MANGNGKKNGNGQSIGGAIVKWAEKIPKPENPYAAQDANAKAVRDANERLENYRAKYGKGLYPRLKYGN